MLSRRWIRRIASAKSGATDTTSTREPSGSGCVSTVSVTSRRSIGLASRRAAVPGAKTACVIAARPAEIQRIYVDAPWHGRGIAQALMAAMLEHARIAGADRVWLGVWEHNPRARRFYEKSGFALAGDHAFVLGHEVQRDLVMSRVP